MTQNERDYRMLSFWSWNGELSEDEIRAQVRQMADRGYGGFFIHARAGLTTPYLSDDWMDACAVAIDEAKRVGIYAWLYDEDGWPSGFAGGRVNGLGEEYQAKTIRFWHGEVPEGNQYRLLASYRKTEGGYERVPDGDASADAFCGYELCPVYVDLLYPDVTRRFIESTHEVYKKRFGHEFGKTVKGMFTDEPQLRAPAWSPALDEAWREKYGGDIRDGLWMIFENKGDYRAFRYRYYETVSALFRDNFTKPVHAWCQANDLIFTGHFSGDDGVCFQLGPNAGVMPHYEHMDIPGIDHLGRRYCPKPLMKQLSSAAHQSGKKQTLTENFGCAGWDITFRDMMRLTAYQAVLGVNTVCAHLSAYTISGRRKRDYPAFYSYQEPWWDAFGTVTAYTERLGRLIGESRRFTKVAVVHPLRSVWCNYPFGEDDLGAAETESSAFRRLLDNLSDIQLDYDLIDDEMLARMTVSGGVLRGEHVSYDTVILPEMESITESTLRALSEMLAEGGAVLAMDNKPRFVSGEVHDDLLAPFAPLRICNTRTLLEKYFKKHPAERDFALLDEKMDGYASGLLSYYGETDGERFCFIFNPAESGAIPAVARHSGAKAVYIEDCASGEVTPVETTQFGGDTVAPISVPAGAGVLLRFGDAPQTIAAPSAPTDTRTIRAATVELTASNALTVDYASFRVDDDAFSEEGPLVRMIDAIYKKMAGRHAKTLTVRYRFTAEYLPEDMAIAVERVGGVRVSLNGTATEPTGAWWLDKSIALYAADAAVLGENEVLLTYDLENSDEYTDLDEVFESERNRFFYKLEPESIYVLGDFDVRFDTCIGKTTRYTTFAGAKTITAPTAKTLGSLTEQGAPFYRGGARISFPITYVGGEVSLRLRGLWATAATVSVGGATSPKMLLSDEDTVSLTPMLAAGENTVTVELLGHNRNLLGPHHHVRRNPCFVGPSVFTGAAGFENFIYPDLVGKETFTDEYTFIPFGCTAIEIAQAEG